MPREARRCPGAFEPEMEEMDVPEAFGAYLPGEDLPSACYLDGFAVVVDDDDDDDDDDEARARASGGRPAGLREIRSLAPAEALEDADELFAEDEDEEDEDAEKKKRSKPRFAAYGSSRSPTIRTLEPADDRRRTRRWRSSRRARRRRDPGSRCGSRRSRTGASTTRRRGARGW